MTTRTPSRLAALVALTAFALLAMPLALAGETPQRIAWLPDSVGAFLPEIEAAAARHGVDPRLVAVVVLVESGGNPKARSPLGASGLMQVMPKTAERIAEARGLPAPDQAALFDPATSLDLGTWFLARQLERFGAGKSEDEAVFLAATAYNAGPGLLRRHLAGEAELSSENLRYRELVAALWRERDALRSATFEKLSAARKSRGANL